MPDNESSRPAESSGRLSRRQFVRLTTIAGAATAAAVVGAGCSQAPAPATSAPVPPTTAPAAEPIATSLPAPTPLPSATAAPAAAPTTRAATAIPATATATAGAPPPTATTAATPATGRPAVMKVYPEVPSQVVVARHSGAWSGDNLEPGALRQMLDAGITRLTGLNDEREAWAALFRPAERIGIKVNTIAGSSVWTPVPLVNAVVAALVAAGIPANQIVVWDRIDWELEGAGFKLNPNGEGTLCYGTGTKYRAGYQVDGVNTKLSEILLGCDALINMPVLKQHGMAGMSFTMKNHYGTCSTPGLFHSDTGVAIPELNALAPIREKTRLIVGSDLAYTLHDAWATSGKSDGVYMAWDPVAMDAVALRKFEELKKTAGQNSKAHSQRANAWLNNAAKLGLGTNDDKQMQLTEVRIA